MADVWSSSRRFPLLMFAAGVDWQHMKLALLNRLSVLAAATKQVIYISSGYRTDKQSAGGGGFAGDPHTEGIAADARVGATNGPYIGNFYSVKILAKYGLRSGNEPNFYKGKPDPMHVDLVGFGYDIRGQVTGSLAKDPYQTKAAAALPAPVGTQIPQQQVGAQVGPPPQTGPELTSPPGPLLPGTVAGDQSPVGAQSFWKRVLDQPSVSQDTQAYAGMFQ